MTGTVILNYNSAADCRKCVSTLMRQEGARMMIVIVDNASGDDDRKAVVELCREYGLTFIQAERNCGYNAGNNIGMRRVIESGCDTVMIANPDMEFPDQDYVDTLRRELLSDADCVAIGSDIIGPDGSHQNPMKAEGGWRSSLGWIGGLLKRRGDADPDFIDNPGEGHQCDKLSGCCLMLKTEFLKSIGLFDETPFLYCEEAILSKQVAAAGKTMRYTTSTRAIHRHIASSKGDPRPRFRHWRRSRLYYIRRYSGYPLYGRIIASISMRLYISMLISVATLRGRF